MLYVFQIIENPLQVQVSLSFKNQGRPNNQIKSISCVCTLNIFKLNVMNNKSMTSKLFSRLIFARAILQGDMYSPKNIDVRSTKQCSCPGTSMIPCQINKIRSVFNVTFCIYVNSRKRVQNTVRANFGVKELI